jgi:phage gp36-like protein
VKDYPVGTTIYLKFGTRRPSTGASYALASGAVSVYKDNSTTQSTAGVTLTADFDALTGCNHVVIDTSADGTFYSSGSEFQLILTGGTVDSISVVGQVVGEFSLGKTSALRPTVAGRTLDVSAGGEAGIDWANIGSPTTAVALSSTTITLTSAYDAAKTAGAQTDLNALLTRLSASRAGYLDYLNIGGAVASQADINAVNQSASRRIILQALEQWERPESGSSTYTIEARTWDGDGAAVNADSTPALTATGGTSGSLAASLSSATNPSTGVYRWTFTVASSATLEQVTLDVSATIGGSTFTLTRFAVILDAVSATWTANDRTKLTAVYDKLPLRSYLVGTTVNSGAVDTADMNAISDAIWDDSLAEHTDVSKFGGFIQLLATAASLTTAAGNVSSILTKLTGITYLKNWLAAMFGKTADSGTLAEMQATTAGATFDNATDSLQALRDHGDTAWGGSGGSGLTGANLVTITVTDGTDPVPGAYVRLKAGGDVEVKRTNGSGVVTFTTDNNTWTVTIDATNLTFESTTLAVTGDTEVTYEMDPVATSSTAWATGDDLVAYYDAKTIGQMLTDDGTAVAAASVPDHAIVTRCLKLASGEVDAALMHCNRYSQAQLEALTDPSLEHLKHITCAVAVWHLQQRRLGTNPERAEAFRKQAQEHLERLRKGELVLNIDALKLAGLIDHVEYTAGDIASETPRQLRDVASGPAGVFPRRRTK